MSTTALRVAAMVGMLNLSALHAAQSRPESSIPVALSESRSSEPVEDSASKHGSVSIGGKTIGYTATAGSLIIPNDQGAPIASVFYFAYTADNGSGSDERPVTFAFNGGPGSSSAMLHLGSVGPVRVLTPNAAPAGGGPFRLVPNDDSILDKTDLVFIDAIGTGLSHALGKAHDGDFWGIDEDVDSFARAITRWTKINQRWNSPKFLLGESYGGVRAAGLAALLQQRAFPLTGVILVSPAVDLTLRNPSYDQFYASFLPSLAAISWYHKRLQSPPADLEVFLEEVRAYALGPYLTALAKGSRISQPERDAVARQLSSYTGLAQDYILKSNLRIDFRRFRKELMREEGRTIGALDARYLGTDADSGGNAPEYDASQEAIAGPYWVATNEYLFKVLGYKSDRNYLFGNPDEVQRGWNWMRKEPADYYPWAVRPMTVDLSAAMRRNPRLKVLALLSYFDLAAPYVETEYDLTHLSLDPATAANLSFAYYRSGHMPYLDPASLRKMKGDLDRFFDSAARPKS